MSYQEFAEHYNPHFYTGRIFAPNIDPNTYRIVNDEVIINDYSTLNDDLIDKMAAMGCPISECESIKLYCKRLGNRDYTLCLVCDKGDNRWQITIEPAPMNYHYYMNELLERQLHTDERRKLK